MAFVHGAVLGDNIFILTFIIFLLRLNGSTEIICEKPMMISII